MKNKLFLSVITFVACMPTFAQTPSPHSYDFFSRNSQGDTIYYLITSPQTVAVSYRCDSVTSWGPPAKRNLYQGNLIVPEKVNWQSVEYRVTSVTDYTFYNCPQITNVSLPDGIDSIGNYNFVYCDSLKKLTLPDSVRYIGKYCFYHTDNLEEVEMGDLVNYIGNNSFSNSGIRRFICPPLISKIDNCFLGCPDLSEVILPEGLDSIECCFVSTPSLKHIQFPNTLKYVNAFNYSGLEEVIFPASVRTIIGFSGCPDLSSVEFMDNCEVDSIAAFGEFDTSLHYLDLTSTKIRVWKKGSLFNKTMRSILLPDGLQKIENDAMGWNACSNQADHTPYFSLVIPQSVTFLDVNAWVHTYSFKNEVFAKGELILKSPVPPKISASSHGSDYPYPHVQVYVPCGSLETYKENPDWNYYYPNIREMNMEEVWVDSLCESEVEAKYGFAPYVSGVYNIVKPSKDSLLCDTLITFYIKLYKAKINDTSVSVYDDGIAFEWSWEGEGEEYDVMRNGYRVAVVTEPFYRDTAVETGVQYCYNFIPYLNGCKGETSMTNCYTRVKDTTGILFFHKQQLTIHPNPAREVLFITTTGTTSFEETVAAIATHYDNIPYEVTDITGRIVLQGQYNASDGICISGLAKGMYLLRMEKLVGKFVKE